MAETQKRSYVVLTREDNPDTGTTYLERGRTDAYGPAEAPRQLREEQEADKDLTPIGAGTYHVVNAGSLHLVRLVVETKTTAQSSLLNGENEEA